jgi:hypothetical protein
VLQIDLDDGIMPSDGSCCMGELQAAFV